MTSTTDKATAQAVAAEIKQAVEAILAKHGLQLTKATTKYGEWFEYKIEAIGVQTGPNGVNLATKEAMYYSQFGWTAYGPNFEATQLTAPLGTLFTAKGAQYVFSGVDPKKRKFPISARRLSDGAMVNFTEDIISTINKFAAQETTA